MKLVFIFVFVATIVVGASQSQLLDPDFEISTETGKQVFREELEIALKKTSGVNPENRKEFKEKAEKLAKDLFRKGQDEYNLNHIELTVYWDWLEPARVAIANSIPNSYTLQINEIMFFSYYEEHMESVVPHEVAHLLHHQRWGNGDEDHSNTWKWIVEFLKPSYVYFELDLTPSCRLSARLLEANNVIGFDPACQKQ